MKLSDIIKNVGADLVREVVPGGGLLLAAVNALLPDDAQLPDGATGDDVARAAESLPPDRRAELLGREFDVEIVRIKEDGATLRAMLLAEQSSTHTTRPRIALGAFRVVSFISILIVSLWAYAVIMEDSALVTAVVDGWPLALAIVGPFVGWLDRYFGTLKQEQRNRLDAAAGNPPPRGLSGAITALVNRGKQL